MEATTVRLGRGGIGPALVPAAGLALTAGTIAYGFVARAEGTRLGASLAPFVWDWRPTLSASALPATALLATGVWLAPRLRAPAVRPWVFAAATLALGLALRPALGSARGGVDGLWAVYEVGNNEAANEYLPALPALDFGTLFFLNTFAEVGTSLPVHAIGHPPGLLLTLHWLGIDGAPGMAALTIGGSAPAARPCSTSSRRRRCSTAPRPPTPCTRRSPSPPPSRSRLPPGRLLQGGRSRPGPPRARSPPGPPRSPWRASSRTPTWRSGRGRPCSPRSERACDERYGWRSSAVGSSPPLTPSSTWPPGTTRSACSKRPSPSTARGSPAAGRTGSGCSARRWRSCARSGCRSPGSRCARPAPATRRRSHPSPRASSPRCSASPRQRPSASTSSSSPSRASAPRRASPRDGCR